MRKRNPIKKLEKPKINEKIKKLKIPLRNLSVEERKKLIANSIIELKSGKNISFEKIEAEIKKLPKEEEASARVYMKAIALLKK